LHIQPKGTGLVTISDGTDFNKGIRFRSSGSAASAVTLLDAVSTAGRVVTLPDATTTLVGRDTTDTLTNKSISGSTNTLSNIGNASLTNSAITINGTSTSLGGSISVGTVTSVTGTAPVVSSGGNTPAISMAAATTSVNGYLTNTDWNTFNNKQPAGTYVNSVSATSPITSSGGVTPTIAMPAATTSVNGYLTSTDWNTFNNKTSNLGTVTSVGGTGTVNGITLTGTVTTSGNLTLGGTLSGVSLTTQVSGTLPVANGGTGTATAFTAGSVVFAGASGVYSQDNASLFFDNTNDRLGVGTASPSFALDVSRSANTVARVQTTATGSFGALRIENTNTNGEASIGFRDSSDSDATSWVIGKSVNATDVFGWYYGGAKMTLDTSGNLLVGTTSVNGRISSVPKTGFAPNITAGTWASSAGMSSSGSFGGGFSWIDGSGGYCAWAENGGADFVIAGGLTGNVVANGVFLNGFSATSWSARSDERLKQNLKPITDALNKTCSLRAVTGAYKNFPDEQQAFLLAQDVQKVLPEAVCVADKRSPEQYLGLAYTQVIPLLVAAIQELKAEIDLLKGN
jgi:hypothetical protein